MPRQCIERRRELDLAQLADVLADQLVEQVEDDRRQHVHAEEAEVVARAQAGHLQPQLGQGRVGLLDDLVDGVDLGMLRAAAGPSSVPYWWIRCSRVACTAETAQFSAAASSINCRAHRRGSDEI